MAGIIDAHAESQRLGRLLGKAREDLAKAQAKLANDNFVRGAPAQVVATERQRAADLERTARELTQQLERVRALTAP
jgi:valyl-tRNA synthetase